MENNFVSSLRHLGYDKFDVFVICKLVLLNCTMKVNKNIVLFSCLFIMLTKALC
jgi:hypothetical protein